MTRTNVTAIVASLLVLALAITGVVVHSKGGFSKKETETTVTLETVQTELDVDEEDSKFVVDLSKCHAYDDVSE